MAKAQRQAEGPQRFFVSALRQLSGNGRQRPFTVFRDFCEMAAIAFSNTTDTRQREAREARYMELVRGYEPEAIKLLPAMLGALTEAMSEGFADVLGQLFMSLEFGEESRGQFFTPYTVSSMMARMNVGDSAKAIIEQHGFITVCEPACGAAGMVVAMAEALHDQGINFQRRMHATAIDIDLTAVHMAYVQLSLLHIPAVVIHGNALLPSDVRSVWYTPAHVLGGWTGKLNRRQANADAGAVLETVDQVVQPAQTIMVDRGQMDLFANLANLRGQAFERAP